MEFALSRKQLNKKREEQAAPPAPSPQAYGAPYGGAAVAPAPGVDPMTGLPLGFGESPGYGPPTQQVPVVAAAPPPAPPVGALAPSAPNLSPSQPSPPLWGELQGFSPSNPMHLSPTASTSLIEARPTGSAAVTATVRRYAGFILVLVIALVMIAVMPSLRHKDTTPSGLGPVPVAGVAAPTAGAATHASATPGAGVVSVSHS